MSNCRDPGLGRPLGEAPAIELRSPRDAHEVFHGTRVGEHVVLEQVDDQKERVVMELWPRVGEAERFDGALRSRQQVLDADGAYEGGANCCFQIDFDAAQRDHGAPVHGGGNQMLRSRLGKDCAGGTAKVPGAYP